MYSIDTYRVLLLPFYYPATTTIITITTTTTHTTTTTPYTHCYPTNHTTTATILLLQVRVDSMMKVAEIEEAEKDKMRNKCKKIIDHGAYTILHTPPTYMHAYVLYTLYIHQTLYM